MRRKKMDLRLARTDQASVRGLFVVGIVITAISPGAFAAHSVKWVES
jgi:hypothetical protein